MLKPQGAFSHERGLDLSRLTDEQLEELCVLAGGKPYLAEERKAKAEHDAQVAEAKRARAAASLEASTGSHRLRWLTTTPRSRRGQRLAQPVSEAPVASAGVAPARLLRLLRAAPDHEIPRLEPSGQSIRMPATLALRMHRDRAWS
jgi:hypothetical protein